MIKRNNFIISLTLLLMIFHYYSIALAQDPWGDLSQVWYKNKLVSDNDLPLHVKVIRNNRNIDTKLNMILYVGDRIKANSPFVKIYLQQRGKGDLITENSNGMPFIILPEEKGIRVIIGDIWGYFWGPSKIGNDVVIVGVEGTFFGLKLIQNGNASKCIVIDGKVTFANEHGAVILRKLESGTVIKNQAPVKKSISEKQLLNEIKGISNLQKLPDNFQYKINHNNLLQNKSSTIIDHNILSQINSLKEIKKQAVSNDPVVKTKLEEIDKLKKNIKFGKGDLNVNLSEINEKLKEINQHIGQRSYNGSFLDPFSHEQKIFNGLDSVQNEVKGLETDVKGDFIGNTRDTFGNYDSGMEYNGTVDYNAFKNGGSYHNLPNVSPKVTTQQIINNITNNINLLRQNMGVLYKINPSQSHYPVQPHYNPKIIIKHGY